MKDVISAYQKQNFLKNSGIIVVSLGLAFGIHTFAFDGGLSTYIKANVLEINQETEKPDLYFSGGSGVLSLQNGKMMNEVTSLSFSFVYDASKVTLSNFSTPRVDTNITTVTNEPGLATFIIGFSNPQDIPKGSKVFDFAFQKLSEDTSHINLLNANFSDIEKEDFFLSTSGITF